MIAKTINFGKVKCDFLDVKSQNIAYILIPIAIDHNEVAVWAEKYKVNIVLLSGMDWNKDLTPWTAPGIKPQDPNFGDGAESFLSNLLHTILPDIEADSSSPIMTRTLIGTSLSGLFALWTWMRITAFDNVASLSGSFWYDGFTDWFCKQPVHNSTAKVYLSLGEKEAQSKAPRFGVVNAQTQIVFDYLRQNKVNVVLKYTPGNHFAPILPRIDQALSFLF